MHSKRALEMRLSEVAGFDAPRADLEQYATPADIAAHLIHLADVHGDLSGTVVDLGAGTGMLALGAAFAAPARVVAIERDADALATARENERRVDPPTPVDWLRADATRPPLCGLEGSTVLMNPPFGAQRGNVHADRRFLEAVAELAGVSYSIHNAGSREFVESFAADRGGAVTHAFRAAFDLPNQFAFHERERATVDAEVFRAEW